MRKLMIACGFLLLWAASGKAQEGPGFEVSGNYQYVRFNPGGGASGINCQGGSGLFGAYLTSRVGVVGEFGGCKVTGLPSGTTSHELNYLVGPRLYFPTHGRVFPFVQTLFGGERFSAGVTGLGSASSSAFAMTAGGGADVTLTQHVSCERFRSSTFTRTSVALHRTALGCKAASCGASVGSAKQ